MKRTFLGKERPMTVGMIQKATAEECVSLALDSIGGGADAVGLQLETLPDTEKTDEKLRRILDSLGGKPCYFTNYRYGIDIGSGNWDFVKTNYLWGMACFATHTGDIFVPNSDSVGLFPGLSDTEAMFCLNYCLVTHTMVEIAGKLSEHADSPRIPILRNRFPVSVNQKSTCHSPHAACGYPCLFSTTDQTESADRLLPGLP